jgi:hypothetical protein
MGKGYRAVISITFLSVLISFSIACSKSPNDEVIAKDIQAKVEADPDTKDSSVNVAAKDGKVTLTGKVKSPAAQQRVYQIAREEPGTSGIDDQTMVQGDNMGPAMAASAPAAAAPSAAMAPPPVEKPKPQPLVVPTGTTLTVRLGEPLSSKTSQTGQTFTGTLAQPVSVGGRTAFPSGSAVSGTVVSAKSKGKIKGEGELNLSLSSITVRGQTHSIQTGILENTIKGKGKRTAVATGGGAAGGALIGGIAGGGKGAGIGALVGAGAGLVGGTLTGNKQIELPAESALSFRLSAPVTLGPSSE